MEALIESEMQQLHVEDSSPSWCRMSGPEEILVEDGSVIHAEYGGEELQEQDLDDGDEKALLYRQLTLASLGE